MVNCCVPECKSSSKRKSVLHRIPVKKRNLWLEKIQRPDLLYECEERLNNLRICWLHFDDNMIKLDYERRMLTKDACPIRNLPHLEAKNKIGTAAAVASISHITERPPVNNNISVITTENSGLLNSTTMNNFHISSQNVNISSSAMEKNGISFTESLDSIQKRILNEQNVHNTINKSKTWFTHGKSNIGKAQYRKKSYVTMKTARHLQRKQIKVQQRKTERQSKILNYISNMKETFVEILQDNFGIKVQGQHFTKHQKAFIVMLYKIMGKQAYTALRSKFGYLPSIKMLHTELNMLPISTGLNPLILEHLKKKSSQMSIKNKVCVLMWNEMPIRKFVSYDKKNNTIYGFEDWGNNRTTHIADHVLVFMLRGLNNGWKMPISFEFTSQRTSTRQLIRCIRQHIKMITRTGFSIIGTICNQRTLNTSAINCLIKESQCFSTQKLGTFYVDGIEVVPIFDPSHLLKETRNNLLLKNIEIDIGKSNERMFASWDGVETAYLLDGKLHTISKCFRKLTDEHVFPKKIQKMLVKNASQVFSATVSSGMELMASQQLQAVIDDGHLFVDKKDGLATAKVLLFFNNLFDSTNASSFDECVELRFPVSVMSKHHDFWAEAKKTLETMQFVDKCTREPLTKVPTFKQWTFTIEGLQKIWKICNEKFGFASLKTKFINQNCLENCIVQIKNHNFTNLHPTPQQFEHSFKSILISNIIALNFINGNCEISCDNNMLITVEECLTENMGNEEMVIINKDDDYSGFVHSSLNVYENCMLNSFNDKMKDIVNLVLKAVNLCEECAKCFKHESFLIQGKSLVNLGSKFIKCIVPHRCVLRILKNYLKNCDIHMLQHVCVEHYNTIFDIVIDETAKFILHSWCQNLNNLLQYRLYEKKNVSKFIASLRDHTHIRKRPKKHVKIQLKH